MADDDSIKTALITGAGTRLGRAVALSLADEGWDIAIHYNSSGADAKSLVEEITQLKRRAVAVQADLCDHRAAAKLVAASTRALGPLSCLINNAGRFEEDTIETMVDSDWEAHFAVNLKSPAFLAQSFAAQLPKGARGNIINMIDQRVWKPTPQFFSYTASKAGLWAITQTLAQALAPMIRVNAIGPGPTLRAARQSETDFARQSKATILQRGASIKDICQAVNFVLNTPSLTGQMLAIDGGQHLAWQTPDVTDIRE